MYEYIYIFLLLLVISIMLYIVFGKINVKCENKYEKSGYRSFNNTRVNTIQGSCIIGWATSTIFTNSSGDFLILPKTATIKNIKFSGLKDCKQLDNTQGFTIVLVCEPEKGGEGPVNLNGKNYVTIEELQTGFDSGEMNFNVQDAIVNEKMKCPEAPLSVNWGVYNINDPTPFLNKKLEIEITYTY